MEYKPNKIPFYFRGAKSRALFESVDDFNKVVPQIGAVMKSIASQKSLRHAVLDTWNLVDFVLRRNLAIFFGLQKFETTDFDPKYDLLPRSFEGLIKCTEAFKKSQEGLPKDIDPFELAIGIPTLLLVTMEKDDSVRSKWFFEQLEKYYQKHYPAVSAYVRSNTLLRERRPKNLFGVHRDLLEGLDDNWFKAVKRLNRARNLAAHTLNEREVAGVFGISGSNSAQKIRKECLALLKKVVGLKKPI